jgi:hypothetical protein
MTPPDHLHSHSPTHDHDHRHAYGQTKVHAASHRLDTQSGGRMAPTRSVLAWPAWLRVVAVMPLLVILWLAVLWANEGARPW